MSGLDQYLPAIVAGDADAFGHWVAGAEARLRLSLSSFAERVDVEALVQETLLRIWQVAPRIEVREAGGGESSLRFAIRVARNLAIDELRRARLSPTEAPTLERMLELAAPASNPEAGAPDPLLRDAIQDCVTRLPKKPSAVFHARMQNAGARHDSQLAAELNMRTNTFLQNFGRARKFLVDCLHGHGVNIDPQGRIGR